MQTLTLTPSEVEQVVLKLEDYRYEEHIDCDVDLESGISVEVYGDVTIQSYREKETGGYVETRRDVNVKVTAFDEEGNSMYVDEKTEEEVRKVLERLEQ